MKRWLVVWCSLALTACGAELDRSSEVETLRVLGVHKTESYAQAGDELTFSMLWHDPKGRDLTPVWFAPTETEVGLLAAALQAEGAPGEGEPDEMPPWQASSRLLPVCTNPPRDNYYYCLEVHRGIFAQQEEAVELLSETGDSITLHVPRSTVAPLESQPEVRLPALAECGDVASSYGCKSVYHPPPDTNDLPNFGSIFLFFALCAGELHYDAGVKEGFGLLCLDEAGEPLGPADYVFGYSQVFLYEDLVNRNPVIEGISVNGEQATPCIGAECLVDGTRPETCGDGVPCLDQCTESDEDSCPEIEIKPLIPQRYPCDTGDTGECENAELDELAFLAYGRSYGEQMWIRYYADHGRMASEVKLLNDATSGWNPDFGTKLRLPKEEGPLRIWTVVYDNRGGQDWARVDAVVRPKPP